MVNKKITDHMSGSNDITLLKVNHAEYHSLKPCGVLLLKRPAVAGDRSLLRCPSRSVLVDQASSRCESLHLPHQSQLATRALGRSLSMP